MFQCKTCLCALLHFCAVNFLCIAASFLCRLNLADLRPPKGKERKLGLPSCADLCSEQAKEEAEKGSFSNLPQARGGLCTSSDIDLCRAVRPLVRCPQVPSSALRCPQVPSGALRCFLKPPLETDLRMVLQVSCSFEAPAPAPMYYQAAGAA